MLCCICEVFNIYYFMHSYTRRREKGWEGRMREKMGKKKEKVKEKKQRFVCWLGFFFFLIAILHIRQLKLRAVK